MIDFVAAEAGTLEDQDIDCFMVAFAADERGVGPVLELQRGMAPFDDDDRERGWDTYCLSINLGAATCYGGVTAWSLHDRVLEIRLGTKAQEALEVDEGYRIDLRQIDASKLSEIEVGLRRVLVEVPPAEQSADNITPPAAPVRRSA